MPGGLFYEIHHLLVRFGVALLIQNHVDAPLWQVKRQPAIGGESKGTDTFEVNYINVPLVINFDPIPHSTPH
jgi:hypothetical protein